MRNGALHPNDFKNRIKDRAYVPSLSRLLSDMRTAASEEEEDYMQFFCKSFRTVRNVAVRPGLSLLQCVSKSSSHVLYR